MPATGLMVSAGRRKDVGKPARSNDGLRSAARASAIVVILMLVESVLGLLVHDLYHEDRWGVAAARGNDLITLALVAPMLALAVARRQRPRWVLVWLGGLFYGVYNFAYYAFGMAFNDVFLLHVATMALAIVALVCLVSNLDATEVTSSLNVRPSDRLIAGYMALVGSALIVAWGGFSLRYAITGELPRDVMPPTAVHLVYALDMSLLAPAFLAGGLLLWRRSAWGYVLGVAVNLFGAAYLVVLEFVGGFEANAGIDGKTWNSPPAIVGAVLCTAAAVTLLRRVSGSSRVGTFDPGSAIDRSARSLRRSWATPPQT